MNYTFPQFDLLNKTDNTDVDAQAIDNTINTVNALLNGFGIDGYVAKYADGPRIVRLFVKLSPGVKYSKLKSIQDNLAACLGNIRFCDPSENTPDTMGLFGIDVPKQHTRLVTYNTFRTSWKNTSTAAFALGEDVTGNGVACDLAKMPHLLIAGASGSGKSVCINSIITSYIFRNDPQLCKLVLIDPKKVELSVYDGIPHLGLPIATSVNDAIAALKKTEQIMNSRYSEYQKHGVRNIEEYNNLGLPEKHCRIVVIIDELADLMYQARSTVEALIVRLAQLARAAGIHLVVATQEPTTAVISGLIKANMPSRIAFATATSKESVVILGHGGAEKLLGKGDMLYKMNDEIKPIRLQGLYISSEEIARLVSFVKKQTA